MIQCPKTKQKLDITGITFATEQINNNVQNLSVIDETVNVNDLYNISPLSFCYIENNNKNIEDKVINNTSICGKRTISLW